MSDYPEVTVRRAGVDDAGVVGEILGDAFSSDPVGKWISPDPEYTKWCWLTIVNICMPELEVYLTENKLGAAIWIPPGIKPNIKLGLTILMDWWWRFGIGSILRFIQLKKMMDKYHPKEDHYYLLAVGVHSESKGQGIGSALLESVLKKCDSEMIGVYLENSNPQNMPFYQRHGFQIQTEITLTHNGPKLWPMYRNPKKL